MALGAPVLRRRTRWHAQLLAYVYEARGVWGKEILSGELERRIYGERVLGGAGCTTTVTKRSDYIMVRAQL